MAATSRSLKITASTTQTITNLNVYGGSGHVMSILSVTAGTAFNITKAGGGVFYGSDYMSVKDTNITNTSWYVGHNSTNVSGNTNVIFVDFFVSALSDAITLTERLSKNISRSFTGSITLSEVFSKVYTAYRSFSSSISLTETFRKTVTKTIASSISLTELLNRNVSHRFSDSVSLVDGFYRTFFKSLNDFMISLALGIEGGGYLLQEDGSYIILENALNDNLFIKVSRSMARRFISLQRKVSESNLVRKISEINFPTYQ